MPWTRAICLCQHRPWQISHTSSKNGNISDVMLFLFLNDDVIPAPLGNLHQTCKFLKTNSLECLNHAGVLFCLVSLCSVTTASATGLNAVKHLCFHPSSPFPQLQ